jgi:hypothetical protein
MAMRRAGPRSIVAFACAIALEGCDPSPLSISALHTPLFLEQPHSSQIVATASTADGLEHINIVVEAGEASYCPSDANVPSAIPCRKNATAQGTTCFFQGGVTTGSCQITQQIGRNSLVTYRVQAKSAKGYIVNLEPVTYSGGERLVGIFCWFLWGFLPILECADYAQLMPIWWQTNQPSGGSTASDRIDISFNRDADFQGNALAYSNMLDPMIRNAFFNTVQQFGKVYTYTRDSFTLWSAPDGADNDGCGPNLKFNFGGTTKVAAAYTDGEVLVYDGPTDQGACANITLGGSAWIWGSDPLRATTFVHESGHMLYALGDEYCCLDSYACASTPRNVHPTKAACETVAASIGVSKSLCVQITHPVTGQTVNQWRITDGSTELMSYTDINADWRDASNLARGRQIKQCFVGDCY